MLGTVDTKDEKKDQETVTNEDASEKTQVEKTETTEIVLEPLSNETRSQKKAKKKEQKELAKREKKEKEKKPGRPKYKKSRAKKIIIILILLVIVGFAAYKMLTPKPDLGMPVTTAEAQTMDLQQVVSIKGTIQGAETADVSSSMDNEVKTLNVKEGDRVKKGQILATLDDSDLQGEYDKALKSLEQSKFKFEANQKLYEEGAVSEEDYVNSKIAYENDQITVNNFTGFEKTKIESPIDGTITRINTSLGRKANETDNNASMFVIEDLDHLQMKVQVSEYDIGKIKLGQSVTITSDVIGEGNTVTGVVSKISPSGEQKEQGSKEMVIPVTINVDKGNSNLMAGVSAKAQILIEEKLGVLTVPVDALLIDPETGKNIVLCVKKDMIKRVPVEIGTEGNLNIEIVSGELQAGDMIVLSPANEMTDGMKVLPTPQQ